MQQGWPLIRWARWCCAAIVFAAAGNAQADDCFAAGMQLSNAGDVEAAADAFRKARERSECDDPLLLLNEALAAEKVALRTQNAGWACRSSVLFESFGRAWDEPSLQARAAAGVATMSSICAAESVKTVVPPAPIAAMKAAPPPPPLMKTPLVVQQPTRVRSGLTGRGVTALSLAIGGAVAGGAGGYFLYAAQQNFDEATSRHQAYRAATTPNEASDLWAKAEAAHDQGTAERWLGYGLVGAGGVMVLTAIVIAATGDDAAPAGLGVTPTAGGAQLGWIGTW